MSIQNGHFASKKQDKTLLGMTAHFLKSQIKPIYHRGLEHKLMQSPQDIHCIQK